MSEPANDQFFSRVEEHFGRRRGGPLVLSPKDWSLLEEWHETGMPLRVVLRGINQAFDRFAASGPRPDRINSLRFCEQEVQAAWEDYRSARRRPAGEAGGTTSSLPAASAHLQAIAEACRAAATRAPEAAALLLLATAAEVDGLESAATGGDTDARSLDSDATAIEQRLRAALAALDGDAAPPSLNLPTFSPYDS